MEFFDALADIERVVRPAELDELAQCALAAFETVEYTANRIKTWHGSLPP
ncbi:hypothetical protein ABH935_009282 [Catenulispora sp. GAS73]